MSGLMQEMRQFGPLIGQALRSTAPDPAKVERLREVLARMRAELAAIINESGEARD
jgi:hypothetical protein